MTLSLSSNNSTQSKLISPSDPDLSKKKMHLAGRKTDLMCHLYSQSLALPPAASHCIPQCATRAKLLVVAIEAE